MMKKNVSLLIGCLCLLWSNGYAQENPKPKYSADVPENILTPDKVETELLGTLEFTDGFPTEETVTCARRVKECRSRAW
jgi:hypothetical protein